MVTVVEVVTKKAFENNPVMDFVGGKAVVQMENRNGVPKIESDTHVVSIFRRFSFEPAESPAFTPENDYMFDQVMMPPVEYPEADWSGKKLFDAVRAGYNHSVNTKGKLPLNNVQVGQHSYAFRHFPDGTVGHSTALAPYGVGGVISLGGGMVLYTNGATPLVVDQNAQPLNALKPLNIDAQRKDTYLNLVDGANIEIELAVPMPLERVCIISSSTRGGYDDIVLDAVITKADGTTVNRKLRRYNNYHYGQHSFADLGAIAKVLLTFKAADQVKGFKARNHLKDGKLLSASLLAAGEGVPTTDLQYIQLFALNNYPAYGYDESALVDITSQYKVRAGTQPAALAGTSVANLIDPVATAGWTAAAVNQASNAFNFELIDPLGQVLPKLVEIEFFQNEAYKGVSQVVVATSASNMGDTAALTANTQRYTLDPTYVPVVGETATFQIEVYPHQIQTPSNVVTITVTEGNATVAMAIKAVRIFS